MLPTTRRRPVGTGARYEGHGGSAPEVRITLLFVFVLWVIAGGVLRLHLPVGALDSGRRAGKLVYHTVNCL